MLKSVRNSAGNVLLQILAATAVMSTSFYFLTNYVIGQKEQVGKTANLVNLRFALNSAMDYVIFGIRQKYCFTNDDMLLNDTPERCGLKHDGNVERIIMSKETEQFIRSLGNNDPDIRMQRMYRYLRVSAATEKHPMFPVLRQLKMVKGMDGNPLKVDGIAVEISRDEGAYLPKAGKEVYLKVKISLKANRDIVDPLQVGSTKLTLESQIVIYPREVGSFALVVPNDLHLDTQWDAKMDPGDISLHKFDSKKELGKSQGLIFQSPVFVNRNIHLPQDVAPEGSDVSALPYAGVTFADRVYLGNGWVVSKGENFAPRTAGGMTDRFWSDNRTFGGFLKGIENDGGLDLGLQYFAGILNATQPSTDLMSRCIQLSLQKASKENLYRSELAANLLDSEYTSVNDESEFNYRLFLTRGNYFSSQTNRLTSNTIGWGSGTIDVDASDYNDAMVKIRLDLGDRWVEAQLPRSGTITLVPEVGSAALKSSLEKAVTTAKTAYDAAVSSYDKLLKDVDDLRKDLSIAQNKLKEEEAKPVKPKASPSPSPSPSPTASPSGGGKETKETESQIVAEASPTPTASPSPSPTADPSMYQDPDVIAALKAEISSLQSAISNYNNNKLPEQQTVVNSTSKTYDEKRTAYNSYLNIVANPPVIEFKTSLVRKYSYYLQDKLNLDVTVERARNLIDKNGNLVAPVVGIQAYDGTYYRSSSITDPANKKLLGYLNFSFNAAQTRLEAPYNVSRTPNTSALNLAEDNTDYGALEEECEKARNAQSSQSFGGTGWATNFAPSTRTSWNFAGGTQPGVIPGVKELILENRTRANATFMVYSIVGKCVIKSSSDFITGFFACDELEIEKRTTPLRIIGTFIVSKARIDKEAIKAGITWSSIYHPQATRELRKAGNPAILSTQTGVSCDAAPKDPIWHPIPSVQQVADRMTCNTISLRAKADPFQWTAVDPDCGMLPGASNTSCKRRLVRFFVVEQSREGGI
ncbi:hypothetical protein QJS83_14010 [Bdellovibrio sp. 22V]|uniref:hypothetical protein n=1 Tax=Bdellovibrio TaxID=958 RepID=UPI002542C383|nr:hypothetical protein [Bdellovibrio sp. 22V]WII71580.1 hypothetical protein QJS83_14010 [Bdellovibrio sp. 22V]